MQTAQNRDPLQEEQELCIEWLRNQVSLIRPKIIVCLGRIAAMKLIKPDMKITKEHGIFFEKNGVLMMATLHPAALLRNPNNKPDAFDDFIKLRDKMKELGI
jgi:uracil-DNA glycosylase family 4